MSYFIIKSKLNGLTLDVEGERDRPGTHVIPWEYHGRDNQIWYDDPATGTIRSKSTQFCLDIESEWLCVRPFQQGDPNQQWMRDGPYIRNRMDHNKVLDILHNRKEKGAKIGVRNFTGGDNQSWEFSPAPRELPQINNPISVYPQLPTQTYPQPEYPQAGFQQPACPQQAVPQPGYPQAGYPQPAVPTTSYPPSAYPQPAYLQPAAPQAGYSPSGYPQPSYPQPGYPQPVAPQPGYPQPAVPQPGYPQPALPQPGYPQPALPQPGYPQPAVPQPGYPQPALLQPGYSQPAVSPPGYPQSGYPQPGYPQPAVPQPGYSQPGYSQPVPQQGFSQPTYPPSPYAQPGYLPQGQPTQQFPYQQRGRPEFLIVSEFNDKVVNIEKSNAAAGARIVTWDRINPPAKNQLWYFDEQGFIHSALNNMTFTNSHNGHDLMMHVPVAGQPNPRAQWKLENKKIANGLGECLDIRGENRQNGAELISYHFHDHKNQHWRFEYV